MRKTKLLRVLLLLPIFAINMHGQSESVKSRPANPLVSDKARNVNTVTEDLPVRPVTGDANYIIGPDDELNVVIWKEPEISRTVPVRPDGKISLALINDVQASGQTPVQLGLDITSRLKKFIADPQVTVVVTRVNSRRIFLVGEVTRAGAYSLLPNMTVLEAISSAGGCTPFAKQTKIYILRKEDGKEVRVPFNYKAVLSRQKAEQNIALKAGDTIVVP
jgi:polysaccharide export outer membrane protein